MLASKGWQVEEWEMLLIGLCRYPRVSAVVSSRQVSNNICNLSEDIDPAELGPSAVICRRLSPNLGRRVEDSEARKAVVYHSVCLVGAKSWRQDRVV